MLNKRRTIMNKIQELDFETRLEIARSLRSEVVNKNSICNKYGVDRTTVTNIGLLYDQYGQPGLRDSSMTPYSKPADVDRSMQEMIITIVLNHPNITTREMRSLLRGEGKYKEPAPIQRFLTQAGLGEFSLRKQYLNELREILNARFTHGIQRFAYDQFVLKDNFRNKSKLCTADENHFLLFGAISLNPRTEPGKSALLHVLINLHSLYVEILVDDIKFLPPPERKPINVMKRQLFSLKKPNLFRELFLWHEMAPIRMDHISIGVNSPRVKILNYAFARLSDENHISFFNKNIDYFEFEIHYKLYFLKQLKRTIERSRAYNSQEGNTELTALNYSIARVQDLVKDYNSSVIEGSFPLESPKTLEEKRGTKFRERSVIKTSDLFRQLLDNNRK